MAVIIDGKVYVNGMYVGSDSESLLPIFDGIVNVDYEQPKVYVVK